MTPGAQEQAASCVHLSDVQRVLTLFTQGIAGRYLQLQAVEPDTIAGKVMARPVTSDATHELVALSVPKAMSGFNSHRHNMGAYRVAVLHQIGFLENGTYSFTLAGARRRMRALPPNPTGYDELGEGAPDMLRFFKLWPLPELMRTVFMTVEDLRVDTINRRRYPGAREDLARVLVHALASRTPPEDSSLPSLLLEALVKFSLGARREDLLPGDSSGLLKPMLDAAAAVQADKANVYDSVRAAAVCYRLIMRAGQANPMLLPGEEVDLLVNEEPGEASASTITPQLKALRSKEVDFRGELNPELMYSESMSGFEDMLDEDIRDTGDGAFGPPSSDAAQEIYERDREHAKALAGVDYKEREDRAAEVRTYLYDEWNYLSQSVLKGWCRLFERRLQGEDVGFIREVRRRHAALSYQVRRRFQFIKPESRQRVHRVSDGEEVELDGLIEAVIDRRAGFATDEHLYMRRDRALRDVAAAFLLDMSGSTGIAVPTGFFGKPGEEPEDNPALQWARRGVGKSMGKSSTNPARRSVIDVAKESLALMCDALETLGDSFAIYGFSGDGRAKVDFLIAKAFEDRLSLRTWAALAAMQPQRSTRMGPAIRHAVAKLRPQPSHMKVLIIVSDGYPQDKDYGPDSADTEYGIQDTAAALREAEREGVQTFCVTIDPAGYDYLRRMCQKDRYMVIEDVADLPDQLQKVYKALTA